MGVRDQDSIESFEPDAALQNLPLCAFAAINEKAMLVVQHDLRRKPAMDGGGGSGGAEEKDFEHGGVNGMKGVKGVKGMKG
jgi:hypothetical protein